MSGSLDEGRKDNSRSHVLCKELLRDHLDALVAIGLNPNHMQ
jgi:hypothetical protein